MTEFSANSFAWAAGLIKEAPKEVYCQTRDVFQGRLDSLFLKMIKANFREDEAALCVAVLGEIGNNCYDHNLGKWADSPGCCFEVNLSSGSLMVCLTDRGQGVLSSLRRVLPDLKSADDALAVSFQKVISGRAPEKRGNGLKFVRSVINSHANRALVCMSGDGLFDFGGALVDLASISLLAKGTVFPGVVTILRWKQ